MKEAVRHNVGDGNGTGPLQEQQVLFSSEPSSFLVYACMELELVNLNAKRNVEGALSTSTLA